MWSSGDQIVVRHVLDGRLVMALPMTVVADDDPLVTWIAPRTPILYPLGLDGQGDLLPIEHWQIVRREWRGPGALDITPWGRAHMIRLFWKDDGAFRGWYVNLQAPLDRKSGEVVTTDHQLDLWLEPGQDIQWKDEHHLAQAVALGVFDTDVAQAIEAEARRVVDEWPFPTGWEKWLPDPAWPVPELPERRDVP